MNKREEAIILMKEIRECRPYPLFKTIDNEDKGIRFVLAYLNKNQGGVIAKELADKMNISTARISVLIKKMDSQKLIKKAGDKSDSRKVIIKLTAKGKQIANMNYEEVVKAHEKLIEEISANDLKTYIKISKKIKNTLNEFALTSGDNNENI